MKKIGFLIGALLIAVTLYSLALRVNARTDDQEKIKALEQRLVAACRAKDINGIMSCYVPDESLFVFDVVPPRQYVGAQAYRKDWEDFLGQFVGSITWEMTDFSVTTDGNIAFGHNVQRAVGTLRDGKKLDLTARITDGYRKINGKWLIIQEHVSVPVDLTTGQADLSSKP